MDYDEPLYTHLVFVYEEAIKYKPELVRAKDDPHPVCVNCKCRIIRSTWSSQVRETRRVSKSAREYEIPLIDVIYYDE